jgi:hypothetical protein
MKPFPSKDFYLFLDSMKPDIARYHENFGYEIEILKHLPQSEKEKIADIIFKKKQLDHHDIEALDIIGSDDVITEYKKRLRTSIYVDERLYIAESLYKRNIISDFELENVILTAIKNGTDFHGFSNTLFMARKHQTSEIRKWLLRSIVFGKEERSNIAKHVYIMYGIQQSELTPHVFNYQKFDSRCLLVRLLVFQNYCKSLKIKPWVALMKGG